LPSAAACGAVIVKRKVPTALSAAPAPPVPAVPPVEPAVSAAVPLSGFATDADEQPAEAAPSATRHAARTRFRGPEDPVMLLKRGG